MTFWILAVLALFFLQSIAGPCVRYLQSGLKHLGTAMGPRDNPPEMPVIGARLDRAFKNLVEALLVFLPVSLLLEMKDLGVGTALTGAMVFFWARVAYVPAYITGVPGVRSAVWTIGHAGIVTMVVALVKGVTAAG